MAVKPANISSVLEIITESVKEIRKRLDTVRSQPVSLTINNVVQLFPFSSDYLLIPLENTINSLESTFLRKKVAEYLINYIPILQNTNQNLMNTEFAMLTARVEMLVRFHSIADAGWLQNIRQNSYNPISVEPNADYQDIIFKIALSRVYTIGRRIYEGFLGAMIFKETAFWNEIDALERTLNIYSEVIHMFNYRAIRIFEMVNPITQMSEWRSNFIFLEFIYELLCSAGAANQTFIIRCPSVMENGISINYTDSESFKNDFLVGSLIYRWHLLSPVDKWFFLAKFHTDTITGRDGLDAIKNVIFPVVNMDPVADELINHGLIEVIHITEEMRAKALELR
jgi:hypothetical protein